MSAPNNKPFFGIKVSKPGVPVQRATNKQLVLQDDFTSRVWYDNQNSRIIEGQLPDGTYGMWVSKTNTDVTSKTADTDGNLVFNSNNDLFKILASGTVLSPAFSSNDQQSVTATHNLGFVPASLSYLTQSTNSYPLPFTGLTPFTDGLGNIRNAVGLLVEPVAGVSGIEFIFTSAGVSASAGLFTIKYYLLQETAT